MTKLNRREALILAAGAPVALGLAGTASAATTDVAIQGMAFAPATITIAKGDTVRWTNGDGAPHTATFRATGADTGRLNRGDTGELTFDEVGTFDYVCAIHPSMRGQVIVTG